MRLIPPAIAVSALTAALMLAPGASAHQPSADYGFEGNFKSSTGSAKNLKPVGPVRFCPPCATFQKDKINGEKQGVWSWLEGDGLRLSKAFKVLGKKGKTYTFTMLVKLDSVDGYRKLVDFDNRNEDEGWYAYDESLYPYDLDEFDYSKQKIQAGKWRQITLTRDKKGLVRGFVDGKKIGKAKDPDKFLTLGSDHILHFLIDDGSSEHSGGMIARLRVWDDALSPKQVKKLGI